MNSNGTGRTLDFRGILAVYGHPRRGVDSNFWDCARWADRLRGWGGEGYNAVVWLGPNEFGAAAQGADHLILRHVEFPEARELPAEENERIISQMKWLFRTAREHGLANYLYTHFVWVTPAFARAHGIDQPMPVSPTVSKFHNQPYGPAVYRNCGVVNEDTKRYTGAIFAECTSLYEDLDGFYMDVGECLPGEKTSFYRDAVASGLRRCGRRPRVIALQWQCTMEHFLQNVRPPEVYDHLWLAYHAYNSEQITDAKPYPGLVEWMETTDLPTVAAIYPANIQRFPFNSPRFAFDIIREMKKHGNFRGFLYWEFSPPGLSALFRKALPLYARSADLYREEHWTGLLAEEFGNEESARHFLNAYNISGRIIPEMCALVFGGSDWTKRELRIPFHLLRHSHWATSPARGRRLVPIGVYSQYAAAKPETFRNRNGSEYNLPPLYQQEAVWGSEGGSSYDVIPPVHMAAVRAMGEAAHRAAEQGLRAAVNRVAADRAYAWMEGYRRLSAYYELKVNAAVAALMHMQGRREDDREEALTLGDRALAAYLELARYFQGTLNPLYLELTGQALSESAFNQPLDELVALERGDREKLAEIFNWTFAGQNASVSEAASATLRHSSQSPEP